MKNWNFEAYKFLPNPDNPKIKRLKMSAISNAFNSFLKADLISLFILMLTLVPIFVFTAAIPAPRTTRPTTGAISTSISASEKKKNEK